MTRRQVTVRMACVCVLYCASAWLCPVAAAGPTVPLVCGVSPQGVNFGAYSARNASPTDSIGAIKVSCRGTVGDSVSYTVALSSGASGSFLVRTMNGAAAALSYNLYTDAARSTVWGDGTGNSHAITDGYALTAVGVTRTYPVYGRLFVGQNVAVGSYADSISVTVTF